MEEGSEGRTEDPSDTEETSPVGIPCILVVVAPAVRGSVIRSPRA